MLQKFTIFLTLMLTVNFSAPASANDDVFRLFGAIEEVIEHLPTERTESETIEWNDAPSDSQITDGNRKSEIEAQPNARLENRVLDDYETVPKSEKARSFLQAYRDGHEIAAWYLCIEVSNNHTDLDIMKWCTKEFEITYTAPIFTLAFLHLDKFSDSDNEDLASLTEAEHLFRQASDNCETGIQNKSAISKEIKAFRATLPSRDSEGKYSAEKFFDLEDEACMRSHSILHSILTTRSFLPDEDRRGAKSLRNEAFEHLRIAASMGDADAMHSVSRQYFGGVGVDFSLEKGIEWEQKAIAAGYTIDRPPVRDLVSVPLEFSDLPVLIRPGIDDLGVELGQISYCLALNSFPEDSGPRHVKSLSSSSSKKLAIEAIVNGSDFAIYLDRYDDYLLISRMRIGGVSGSSFGDIVSILGAVMHDC